MKTTGVIGLALACGACNLSPRTVSVDLVTHASCGWSATAYDISCLGSLEVQIVTPDGAVQSRQCRTVTGQYQTLSDLVTPSQIQTLLADVPAHSNVRVELRGYHSLENPPCTRLAENSLLLWGSSDPINLDDDANSGLAVQIECRPTCDCAGIAANPTACPSALTPGVCAPPDAVLCRKPCSNADICYAGLLACVSNLCAPDPGGLCANCTAGAMCSSGMCAKNGVTAETFCAWRCPPEDNSTPCPQHMSCKPLGNIFTTLP